MLESGAGMNEAEPKAAAPSREEGGEGGVLLRMEGIRKAFPPVVALSDVTFSVRRGTVCALCGEILERRCPNCGAPVHAGAICSLCGQPYISAVQ